MRAFVIASHNLTDHEAHGEGLIAHSFLSRLASLGIDITAVTARSAFASPPPYEVIECSNGFPFESLGAFAFAARVARCYRRSRTAAAFDVVWWMLPIGETDAIWYPAPGPRFVAGPYNPGWPSAGTKEPPIRALPLRLLRSVALWRHRRFLVRLDLMLESLPGVGHRYVGDLATPIRTAPFGAQVPRFVDPPSHPTIVFAGSLEERKGVRDLIEAFVAVRRVVPSANLRIAGSGSLEAELRARVDALSLSDCAEFVGRLAHHDVPAFFQSGSVVCIPSRGEPFGLVVLEAMAAGRPIVATNSGGPGVLLKDCPGARIFDDRDIGALSESLINLLTLSDAERQAMGAGNRRLVEERYSWDVCSQRIADYFEDLIK